jgi:beta-lactamase regulating signal transducer with metallopeptidase domain
MTAMMIEAALRALLFAIAVGVGLRVLRVQNVPVRKAAWSVVLIASLAMPLLMSWPAATALGARFAWVVPIRTQQLVVPRVKTTVPVAPVILVSADDSSQDAVSASTAISVATTPEATMAEPVPATKPEKHWPSPGRLIAMVYLAVAGALLLRLLWGVGVALRLWITAELVSPLVAPEPNVRSSSKIPSPVTIGSGIVLPANYIEWDMRKLRVVLAHERSHVRQQDFYLQLLAGVYTSLFWFSPLGWWLRRTLTALGEAIGDRAGLDAAASRSGYAEVLLEFAAMPRQTLPGVAMARTGNLSRRIEWLLNEHHFRSAFAVGRRRALASLLLIPAALFAATALIRLPGADAQTAPPAPASAPAPAAAPDASGAPDDQAAPNPPAEPPQDQSAPATPNEAAAPPQSAAPQSVPPASPAPGKGTATSVLTNGDAVTVSGLGAVALVTDGGQNASGYNSNGYAYHFSDNGDSYAIIEGPGNDITFSGDWGEDRAAQLDAARKVAKGPFLWFTHDGKSYVVTDPAIVAKIRAMYKPMEALGQQQEALGKQQEELGRQQEELGRKQEQAATVRIPDLSKETAEIDEELAKLKAEQGQEMSQEKLGEMQEKLSEMQARLGELQGEAGERQGEFGAKMGALGEQQGALGAQQGKLGAEQGRLAQQADRQVRSIIDESLRNGKATQVPNLK